MTPAALAAILTLSLSSGCEQTLDVGHNTAKGKFPIPVATRSPAILVNDRADDNWSPEFAALFTNSGGPQLVGIVVNGTKYWPDLDDNMSGWNNFVSAVNEAMVSGLPAPIRSEGTPFVVPPDRQIDSTERNNSAGAQFIVQKSRELSQPWQPVIVYACTQLTDIADAYLIDPTIVDRVVIVALLGSYSAPKGPMTGPNGDLDPWADWIVAQKFQYVQVSDFYDQGVDVTTEDLANLPKNAFGAWMAVKHPKLSTYRVAADQEAILALAAPEFIGTIVQSAADTSAGFDSPFGQGPPLVPNPSGNAWLVMAVNPSVPHTRLWKMLNDPAIFKR